MKEFVDPKSRKEIEDKLLALFGETMQPLPKEIQMLLADDLVTAFESRFKALNHAQNQWTAMLKLPRN
jgi:hypothetical protein